MASNGDTYLIGSEPYYQAVGDECLLFEAAYLQRLPVLLKGPTGCGKTRFVEFMAWRLNRPLVTVACHDDTSASDLTGRWLFDAQGTQWQDGPLTLAARLGAICYLDELLEARPDTTVIIHPLTDTRRVLPLEKNNEQVQAHPDFLLVASYNPGHHKLLKPATRQRFCALNFSYPSAEMESLIVSHESGVSQDMADGLVALATRTRRLQGHGLEEGASTRMLVHAGQLIAQGIDPHAACYMAVANPLSDDPDVTAVLMSTVDASFA
ncbi:MAG: AAA family ATPase [Burkholderiaceae bacterium]|nr:AAA family ATPase [Burkholderiaceae bacterium]